MIQRFTITDDYSLFADHEVVIESIVENIGEKKKCSGSSKMFYLPQQLLEAIPLLVNSGDVDPPSGMLTHPCLWAINERAK